MTPAARETNCSGATHYVILPPPLHQPDRAPQTNGVAERFNRTMKEQKIHGRIFRNVDEVRDAVVDFKDRYNREWRLEKLGFMSPLEARQARLFKQAA
ncbi:integrase core domain-containing protein [Paraburkholderia azotifigens]|uniref:integrase core domain-containing protein n=1 Tax=Paraburkholderia azotifigens TaxID=2057004 RepID=UPI003179FD5D